MQRIDDVQFDFFMYGYFVQASAVIKSFLWKLSRKILIQLLCATESISHVLPGRTTCMLVVLTFDSCSFLLSFYARFICSNSCGKKR